MENEYKLSAAQAVNRELLQHLYMHLFFADQSARERMPSSILATLDPALHAAERTLDPVELKLRNTILADATQFFSLVERNLQQIESRLG